MSDPLEHPQCISVGVEGVLITYRKDPKFSDIHVWENSADPDQTAPRGAV